MNVVEIVLNAVNKTGSVFGEVSKDLDNVGTSAEQAGKKIQDIGASTAKVGAGLTAGVTTPLAIMGVTAINSASDLSETLNKTQAVFGSSADAIVAWSEQSSGAFGLSQQAALDAASTFGNLFAANNVDTSATEEMSQSLVQLAADLASFNNISVEEALTKLQSGVVGESEPLRALGVNISAAAVEAKALEMGLADANGEFDESAKMQARYAIIMEQTKTAQGDFAATSTGLANSQRIMKAELANVTAELGTQLLPIAQQAVSVLLSLVQSFSNLSPEMQRIIVIGGGIAAALGPALVAFGAITSAVGTLLPAITALGSALGFIVSPIGLITAAVVGLLAVLFNWGGANERLAAQLEAWGLSGAAEFITGLHEGMMGLVDTIGQLFSGNMTFSEFFDAAIPEWISTLFSWTWPILGPIAWIVKLTSWAWPKMSKPDWIENLLNFRWPGFPSRPSWLGGGGESNATGTSYFRGGATMVGETGPEMVFLPRGSRIFPAGQTEQMMAAGVGGMNITINANVSNEADITTLARRVAAEIQRRNR